MKILIALLFALTLFTGLAVAQTPERGVYLLEPGLIGGGEEARAPRLTEYLAKLFPMAIGLLGLISVIRIAYGGLEYMTSNLPGAKSDGKGKISGAIWGLILALSAYIILYTVNPSLVDFSGNWFFPK